MSILSDRLQTIQPSPTLSLTKKAADLRAEGKDILSLGAGEPDFGTPEWVKVAASQAMVDGKTKYTAVGGTPALKAAVQEKFTRENGLTYTPEEIIISTGGKQVIFNAFLATLNPGDEVIIPAPYWVSYPDIVRLCDGVPVSVPCEEAAGFKLSPGALQDAITSETKWLVLNSPSNPTGAVYDAAELLGLAEVLRHHPQVWILSDDIYEHICYLESPFKTLAQVAPDL